MQSPTRQLTLCLWFSIFLPTLSCDDSYTIVVTAKDANGVTLAIRKIEHISLDGDPANDITQAVGRRYVDGKAILAIPKKYDAREARISATAKQGEYLSGAFIVHSARLEVVLAGEFEENDSGVSARLVTGRLPARVCESAAWLKLLPLYSDDLDSRVYQSTADKDTCHFSFLGNIKAKSHLILIGYRNGSVSFKEVSVLPKIRVDLGEVTLNSK
jgi:hypothetical protein